MAQRYSRQRSRAEADGLARGLGWFSLGLGVAQIFAPRAVSRPAGIPAPSFLVRFCGIREVVVGIGILTQHERGPWVKARIAGDAIDLAGLAATATAPGADLSRIAVAGIAVAGVTALDIYCSHELSELDSKVPTHITASIAVNRAPEDLYRFWRNFSNLPQVMPHLQSVQVLEGNRLRWVAKAPMGAKVEWDSEIIDDEPDQRLAWRSLEGSRVFNAGSVRFDRAPGGVGTYVTVELLYSRPGGTIRALIAKFLGREAGHEARADLRAFKQLMETGEITTGAAQRSQPSGRRSAKGFDHVTRAAT